MWLGASVWMDGWVDGFMVDGGLRKWLNKNIGMTNDRNGSGFTTELFLVLILCGISFSSC